MSRLIALLLIIGTAACAQLPSVDADIASAQSVRTSQLSSIEAFRMEGERIGREPFVGGNDVELLRDGIQVYPAMLAAIHAARHRIDMESYMLDEKEGRQFANALIERRRHGVEVNLICDAWGSNDTPKELFDEMSDAGIKILYFNTLDPINIISTDANHRDHRKLLIIDGKIAFTGGVNITEVYRLKLKFRRAIKGTTADDGVDLEALPWRDTVVRIKGPVVPQFEKLFVENWLSQKGPGTSPPDLPNITPAPIKNGVLVQELDVTPDDDRFTIYRSLIAAITLARKSIHLSTGYFVPTPDLKHALTDAAQRDVDVELVLPSQSDSTLALEAGHSDYEDLLEAGVKIYERQGAVLHAKTAVIDELWSTIGSYNLDMRSILFNNECNAVILSPAFAAQMEQAFINDRIQSLGIDPAKWKERSIWQHMREWRARIASYFL